MDVELSQASYDDAARDATSRFESTLTFARQNLVLAHVQRRDFAAARAVATEAWPLSVRFGVVGLICNTLALLAALEGRAADAAQLAGYADQQNRLQGDRPSNETRAARDAERIATMALGAAAVADLMTAGASLSLGEVWRIGLQTLPAGPI